MTVAESLTTFGYAPVLAYTRGTPSADLLAHFSAQDDSPLAYGSRGSALALGIDAVAAPLSRPAASAARVYPRLGIVYGTVDRAGLKALKEAPGVDRVSFAPQLSLIRPVASERANLRRQISWGITALGVPKLWDRGLSGNGVKVAHLDTGVDGAHPALSAALSAYAEFDLGGLRVDGATPRDSDQLEGHGTHTAAIIAGRPVKRRRVGVAPGVALCSAMVIDGGDIVARMLNGMEWAIEQEVKVLSMSLGIRGFHTDFLGVTDALRDNGVLPIVAVGNEGPGTSRSPGNYPQVLSVGYVGESNAIAAQSSSQRFDRTTKPVVPDVVAPGEQILSAAPGGGWRALSGSSMAVPHVTGLAALLFEAHPKATIGQVEDAIYASARLGALPPDRVNLGEVDGPRALAALTVAMTG